MDCVNWSRVADDLNVSSRRRTMSPPSRLSSRDLNHQLPRARLFLLRLLTRPDFAGLIPVLLGGVLQYFFTIVFFVVAHFSGSP